MCRKKCLTGTPFWPLVLPKVDKWQPNMLQKTPQWHQKPILCTSSFKNGGMCDLHSIYNTLTTFATPVNSYFRPLCTTLTRDFAASVSNCVLEPSEMTSLCDFGTPFDTIGPQTVPHGLQNASPNPPENETWGQVVPRWRPRYPHDLKITYISGVPTTPSLRNLTDGYLVGTSRATS